MKDVLAAVQMMGTQVLALTTAFTPLVNSSVGQVTPAPTAAQAAQTAAQVAQTAARVAWKASRVARTAVETVEDQAVANVEVM